MNMRKGREILMEALMAEGVRHIFGNPGTTELPLIESLVDQTQVEYILSLHEAPAVIMADAYAQTSGQVGVVNLHVGPGLGNGLGAVYNAWEGKTPLVVSAGQQHRGLRLREPLLSHDLVAMARPLVKWSVEAESVEELPLVLYRAFKTARETPPGPVFVSLPMDVMEAQSAVPLIPPAQIHGITLPQAQAVQQAVSLLLGARRPVVFCGDSVARSGGVDVLTTFVELLGAAVYSEVLPSHLNMSPNHAHFRERALGDYAGLRTVLEDADLVLLVGGEFFEEVWFSEGLPFAEGTKVLQVEADPRNMARNLSVDCGLLGDPAQTLHALCEQLEARADASWRAAAETRRTALRAEKKVLQEEQQRRLEATYTAQPMSAARCMHELARALPVGVQIAGEAITSGADLLRSLPIERPGDYLASRGGGIGQAIPSAIGMRVARPDRPTLCISGDGSSLYTIQGLWSAAHHALPVVFVILNNGIYRILKQNMKRYRHDSGVDTERPMPHLDLTPPAIDYVRIAQGFGVRAARVENADALGDALRTAFASAEPWLLDVSIHSQL